MKYNNSELHSCSLNEVGSPETRVTMNRLQVRSQRALYLPEPLYSSAVASKSTNILCGHLHGVSAIKYVRLTANSRVKT